MIDGVGAQRGLHAYMAGVLAGTGAVGVAGAMFPANVHAARHGLNLGGKPVTPLPLRCVLQLVFVAACVAAAA